MPRQKSLVTAIRDIVRREVGDVIASIFGNAPKPRRRRGGKWRPGGPGRPPAKVAARKRPRKPPKKK